MSALQPDKQIRWDEKDVVYQTLRSSGPGGQHVNKTESAVRATHVPSGISVLASERRSQHQNKSAATERLRIKIKEWLREKNTAEMEEKWNNRLELERGNPVRVFKEPL